jgi:hypothetical protein
MRIRGRKKVEYVFILSLQNAEQNHIIKSSNKSLENVAVQIFEKDN